MTDVAHAWAYALTITGGAGELAALTWGVLAGRRGRRRVKERIAYFRAAKIEQGRARPHATDRESFDHDWDIRLRQILGRDRSQNSDLELIPEYAALAVLEDQARAILGPVALLILATFASTVGSFLSIT